MKTAMNLSEYLGGIRAASTASSLEAAIQAPFRHLCHGRTWARICREQRERGVAICDAHPAGRFVPRIAGNALMVCDECYRVGRGYNSTGLRYVWHDAGAFVKAVLRRNGLSTRAASRIWDCWMDYPHRRLTIVEDALNGKLNDPPLNTLLFCDVGSGPINLTVLQTTRTHTIDVLQEPVGEAGRCSTGELDLAMTLIMSVGIATSVLTDTRNT